MTHDIQNADAATIKKDRMRFKSNSLSSNLTLLAVVLNVLYFVCIYKSDVSTYYYTYIIGLSVIYNLVFMLVAFLSSIGVKNYKINFSIALIVIGALQVVRIFGIPLNASNAVLSIGGEDVHVMGQWQFVRTLIYLISSSALLIAAGVIGIIRSKILQSYKQQCEIQQSAEAN